MRDIPIIFSGPMVRALLEGRKTMTRRLAYRKAEISPGGLIAHKATSWTKVWPGDRLYVRENFYQRPDSYWYAVAVDERPEGWKMTPCIHMPRKMSRLTLEITSVSIEPLHSISESDAIAEGIEYEMSTTSGRFYRNYVMEPGECPQLPYGSFESLWRSLHGDEGWDENPDVVALSFRVRHCNIDSLPGAA